MPFQAYGKPFFRDLMLPSRTRKADLEALYEFKSLIDTQFWKDNAHRSVFLWRLGSNIFQIIGHTDRCRADFAEHIAPRFLLPAAATYGLRKSWGADGHGCRKRGCSRISRLPRGRPRPIPLNKQKQPRIAHQGCFCKIYHSFINPVPAETPGVRIFKERKKEVGP